MNAATQKIIAQLKREDQDFEWYPTTTEILEAVRVDLKRQLDSHHTYSQAALSVMDIGAGDGRALMHLSKGDRYAIELSPILREQMDPSICIIGTDFHHQTLIDKQVDVVFCNPPYSEFEMWATKIIREANATVAYLVIPARWADNEAIAKALKARKAKATVVDAFDFLGADRSARAKVDIIRIELRREFYRRESHRGQDADNFPGMTDPFDLWFDDTFTFAEKEQSRADGLSDADAKMQARASLVPGNDYVVRLVELYELEMTELFETYRKFEGLDPDLLREVGVSVGTVKKSLRSRIAGLKNVYWKTFFDVFNKIASRLTVQNRKKMLERITAHVSLDFTAENAYAMAVWAIKNANQYYDAQVIQVFERMIEDANVIAYKSNEATFQQERWRFSRGYREQREALTHYRLDYRVVLESTGGIATSSYSWENTQHNGLTATAVEYLSDLRTVANNLGFETEALAESPLQLEKWTSGAARVFHAMHKGKQVELMRVRAFKNGNIHIQFNQKFLLRLNVEFGRLKGWLKNKSEAAHELDAVPADVDEAFHSNLQMLPNPSVLLLEGGL